MNLSNLVYAYATLGEKHESLLSAIAEEMSRRPFHSFRPTQVMGAGGRGRDGGGGGEERA